MDYIIKEDIYNFAEKYYDSFQSIYKRFVQKSREKAESLLGNYGGGSGGYMGKMPPRDQRVQDYFS